MSKKTYLPVNKDFVESNVTDSVFRKIIDELKTNENGTKKNEKGRKRELTREILRNYLSNLSLTGAYELSAESAGLPEKRRQKYMSESETFRGVSNLAKNNISLQSKKAIAEAILGRKPSFYKIKNPETSKFEYAKLREVLPNVNVAMWWLEKVDKIGKEVEEDDPYKNPILGAPRNEQEAKLLQGLLNGHYEYVKEKEKENVNQTKSL